MSTAAGQKFLNENLHRTALLSSHIPNAQTAARSSQGTVAGTMSGAHPLALMQQGGAAGGGGGMASTAGTDFGGTGGSQAVGPLPPPPSTNPIYVRISAVVADWEVPEKEVREQHLISESPAVVPEEEEPASTAVSPTPVPQSGAAPSDPKKQAPGERTEKLPVTVEASVMEEVLRDILGSQDLQGLLGEMVAQEAPYFVQFEDSAAPGEGPPPVAAEPAKPPEPQKTMEELETEGVKYFDRKQEVDAPMPSWASAVLCDFSGCKPRKVERPAWEQEDDDEDEAAAAMDTTVAEEAEVRRLPAVQRQKQENPELLWDKALELGEVDLPAFKASSAQALDEVLLTSIDDVISGRFNWTRPLPASMAQRRLSSMEIE